MRAVCYLLVKSYEADSAKSVAEIFWDLVVILGGKS